MALRLSIALLLSSLASPAAAQGAAALPAPMEASQRQVRELANLEIEALALDREREQTGVEQAVAVTLFIGAVGGAIASVSLALGTILEAICIDGVIDDCLDGPSYVAAAIPTALVTATLFVGASIYQNRVDARRAVFDERGREIEERRERIQHDLGLALGPTSLWITGTF